MVWFILFFNSWDISLPYFKPGRCLSLCTLLTRLHLCVASILQQENITWIFSIIFVFVFFLWQSQGFDPLLLLLLPFLFAPTFKSLPATCCWRQLYEAKIYNAVVFFYQLVMMQNFNWKMASLIWEIIFYHLVKWHHSWIRTCVHTWWRWHVWSIMYRTCSHLPFLSNKAFSSSSWLFRTSSSCILMPTSIQSYLLQNALSFEKKVSNSPLILII